MSAHPHAENMRLYAEDAAETDKPWERWEGRSPVIDWTPLTGNPPWNEVAEYRRKPKPMECWANFHSDGSVLGYRTEAEATSGGMHGLYAVTRKAVHMREVTE